jgi:hypothetical protein
LVGKPEGKRPLERPKPRWEDNIKIDERETEFQRLIGFIWLIWVLKKDSAPWS